MYKVVKSDGFMDTPYRAITELESKVNALMADGYSPIGGVALDSTDDGQFLYQALIKQPTDTAV